MITVFKKTEDNFRPSYQLNTDEDQINEYLVEVSFYQADDYWKITVSGEDDLVLSISKVYETSAWQIFVEVIGQEYVNIKWLKEQGFRGN